MLPNGQTHYMSFKFCQISVLLTRHNLLSWNLTVFIVCTRGAHVSRFHQEESPSPRFLVSKRCFVTKKTYAGSDTGNDAMQACGPLCEDTNRAEPNHTNML